MSPARNSAQCQMTSQPQLDVTMTRRIIYLMTLVWACITVSFLLRLNWLSSLTSLVAIVTVSNDQFRRRQQIRQQERVDSLIATHNYVELWRSLAGGVAGAFVGAVPGVISYALWHPVITAHGVDFTNFMVAVFESGFTAGYFAPRLALASVGLFSGIGA